MAETVKLADEATADLREDFKMTELGPLPHEWEVLPLGEIARITMGQSPPSSTYNTDGRGLPFLQGKAEFGELFPTPVKWCSAPQRVARRGSVLISVRAPVGDVNLADTDYCIGRGLACICGNEKLDNEFLFFYLKQAGKYLESRGSGTIFNSITKDVLRCFPVPLPPLTEQRPIAHVLRCVKLAKEATHKSIAAARELKKSLMRYLFTYGPVPVEEAERVPLKETEIGPVPPKWEVKAFEDAFVGTARAPKVKRSDYRPVGRVPVIDQGKDFIAGFVDNVEPYQRTLPVIVFGDHTRIFKFVNFPFVVGADGTKVLIPNYDLFEPRFLFYALTRVDLPSRGYNRHFHLLREVSLPLPPLHEQRKIACILQAVDRKIEAEEQRKAALDVLFKTLLHLLMTGRMRVKDLPLPEAEGVLPGAFRE